MYQIHVGFLLLCYIAFWPRTWVTFAKNMCQHNQTFSIPSHSHWPNSVLTKPSKTDIFLIGSPRTMSNLIHNPNLSCSACYIKKNWKSGTKPFTTETTVRKDLRQMKDHKDSLFAGYFQASPSCPLILTSGCFASVLNPSRGARVFSTGREQSSCHALSPTFLSLPNN